MNKRHSDLSTIIITLLAFVFTGTVVFLIITKVVVPIMRNNNSTEERKKS